MNKRIIGDYQISTTVGTSFKAFIPKPLPPDPPLVISTSDLALIEQANRALGRLDGWASLLPDTSLFLYMYIRKEAVLSSQIEGTQSSLSDLLLFESEQLPFAPLEDVQEVSCYVAAMEHGLKRIKEGFPISLRLLREVHERLLNAGRGYTKSPGEFRRSQNWIGGGRPDLAHFVPPPPEAVMPCMGDLERFIHSEEVPLLLKTALIHVQFETIHPFLDGNGRLGRLLITLLLCAEGALSKPVLYLSLYFKTHRQKYYDGLDAVRKEGDWEGWVRFFLKGVQITADQATQTAQAIQLLFQQHREVLERLGRVGHTALRVHEILQIKPIISITKLVERTKLSYPTVNKSLKILAQAGIVREVSGQERYRIYAYESYIQLLSTEINSFEKDPSRNVPEPQDTTT